MTANETFIDEALGRGGAGCAPIDCPVPTVDVHRVDVDTTLLHQRGAPILEPNVPGAPLLVRDADTGDALMMVGRYPDSEMGKLRAAFIAYRNGSTSGGVVRQGGSRTTDTTPFGYLSSNPMVKRQSCRTCGSAPNAPGAHAAICDAAHVLAGEMHRLIPDRAEHDEQLARGAILPDWMLAESWWTSGVLNYNSPISYHRDANNLACWSAMVVLRRGVRGGHLHVPDYDLVLPCRDGDVVWFAGYDLVHAVTPMIVRGDGYRYSAVFYTGRMMRHCGPAAETVERSRARHTVAEDTLLERQRANGSLGVEITAVSIGQEQAEPIEPKPTPVRIMAGSRRRVALPLLRWCARPTVLVEPQEIEQYRTAHPTLDLVELAENDRGFAYMLNRMVELTIDAGERYFVFTDDDVTDLRARTDVDDKFRPCRGDAAEATLAGAVAFAEQHDLAQLAISFAGQSWGAKKAYQEPAGSWGVHVTDAHAVRAVGGYDETLPIFNDWELTARLLTRGYRCGRTNLVTFVHKMKAFAGGAADLYARREMIAETAARVVDLYPEAARVEHVEAHGLDEVRFNWRKLAAAGSPETLRN